MDEMGGSEILHISSSLSTPNKAISSGIGIFVILQVSEMAWGVAATTGSPPFLSRLPAYPIRN